MGNLKCPGLCVGDREGVRRWCDTLGISYANLIMFSDNFKSPTVIRGSPLHPLTTTVWVDGTTVWVDPKQSPTGIQL